MSIEKRLERVEAILDARGLDWDHPRVASDHFAGANKMVVEEPAKKWRILELGEVVCSIDWANAKSNPPSDPPNGLGWIPVIASVGTSVCEDDPCIFARPVADEPAKVPEPAWEPKVGDWVRVTMPENWEKCWTPCWLAEMHQFDGKVGQVERGQGSAIRIRGFVGSDGLQYQFHRDWLSPAEPPAKEEPAEPEYREPVLPADAGKYCQFSDDGIEWRTGWLNGWVQRSHQWVSHSGGHWRHCRIKKDA